MNTIKISGNLTAAAALKQVGTESKSLLKFRLGSKRSKGSNNSDFVTIVAWDEVAKANPSIAKGAFVSITGQLRIRPYETENGKRNSVEIVARSIKLHPKTAAAAA